LAVSTPVWVTPSFNWQTLIGVGLPLFIVTMASQNIPGVAVMRAAGYHPPISPLITTTGVATLVLAPFGGFAINLAAITAAICMGPEADEDPAKRYVAAIFSGGFAVLLGVFGAIIGALFAAFPKALVLAVAGLALLGTIGNALSLAVKADDTREAALVTFLATASGISLFGIGSAFWGLVLGGLTLVALKKPAASA
jgi:benzoate membrane transport protein